MRPGLNRFFKISLRAFIIFNLTIFGIILSLGVFLIHKTKELFLYYLKKNVLISASWRGYRVPRNEFLQKPSLPGTRR